MYSILGQGRWLVDAGWWRSHGWWWLRVLRAVRSRMNRAVHSNSEATVSGTANEVLLQETNKAHLTGSPVPAHSRLGQQAAEVEIAAQHSRALVHPRL